MTADADRVAELADRVIAEHDPNTVPIPEYLGACYDAGLSWVHFPAGMGGLGVSRGLQAVADRILQGAGGPVPLGLNPMGYGMAAPTIREHGQDDDLKKSWLRPLATTEHIWCQLFSEPGAGSDLAGLATSAVADGDEWVINGSKLWITNGLQADWVCLLCRTSDEGGYKGMSQIVVPTNSEGFSVSRKLDKLGMRASDTAELAFNDMRVPVENTIGEIGRGFQQQMNQFQNERMIAAYQMVGAVELALERTSQYLKDRKAFGAPLLANQAIQYELADISAQLEVLRHHNWAAVAAFNAGQDITRHATVAKLLSARLARRMADAAVQYHGGMGYVEDNWPARFFRDTRLWSIGGGADEVMLRTLARLEPIGA